MNLIQDAWIPVRRRSGAHGWIRPAEALDPRSEDPVLAVDTGRPDLNSVLTQFLIGLLQTTLAPRDEEGWEARMLDPPAVEEAQAAFDTVAAAFMLDGAGPRFMQEAGMEERECKGVSYLLPDAMGEGTLFVKPGTVEALCPACAAAGLYALLTHGPAGGRGHMTGLRGGGPLATLPLGGMLWETCWLAVLPEEDMAGATHCDSSHTALESTFPWMGVIPTSAGGRQVFPQDIHPSHVYWAMGRRLWLEFEQRPGGACDLCGRPAERLVTGYRDKPNGIKYGGEYLHPLTPYYLHKDAKTKLEGYLPLHGQPGGVGYDRWVGLMLGMPDKSRIPAAVVERFHRRKSFFRHAGQFAHLEQTQLWVSGYDLDNMKPRSYVESTVPLIAIDDPAKRDALRGVLTRASSAANLVRSYVVGALKEAWFARPKDAKGNFAFVERAFWRDGERDYAGLLDRLLLQDTAGTSASGSGVTTPSLMEGWRLTLIRQAERLFDDHALRGEAEDGNFGRVARARIALSRKLNGPKLRTELDLPKADGATGAPTKEG